MTLQDICDKLLQVDEVTLLEILNIKSEDIVTRFIDNIEERADYLEEMFDDDTD